MLVQQQFSSKLHFKFGRSVEGPLASSLLRHEFHVGVPLRFNVPKFRTGIEMRHWHWIKLSRFWGGNSGLRLWNYDLQFEILLMFGGKDSGMEIWNLHPPLLSCAYHCRDMPIAIDCSTVFSDYFAFLWEPRCPISFLAFPSDQRGTSWIAHWNWELRGPKVRVRTGQLENCGSPIQQEVMIWNALVNLESGQP